MIILATDFWSSLGATGKGLAKLSNSFKFSFSSWSKWSSFRTSLRGNREGSWSRPGTALRSEIPEIDEIKENFVLFDFWQFWFHQKNTRFFFVWKNSWKQSGFVLFDCWPFWFHEKNSENYFEIRKKKPFITVWLLTIIISRKKMQKIFVCKNSWKQRGFVLLLTTLILREKIVKLQKLYSYFGEEGARNVTFVACNFDGLCCLSYSGSMVCD